MIAFLLLSTALALLPVEHPDVVTIQEADLPLQMSLDALDAARAPEDARHNWAEGRRHLLGVTGFSRIVPGGPEHQAPADWPHGVVFIAGTSDHWVNEQDAAFNRAALSYAERYNLTLLGLSEDL